MSNQEPLTKDNIHYGLRVQRDNSPSPFPNLPGAYGTVSDVKSPGQIQWYYFEVSYDFGKVLQYKESEMILFSLVPNQTTSPISKERDLKFEDLKVGLEIRRKITGVVDNNPYFLQIAKVIALASDKALFMIEYQADLPSGYAAKLNYSTISDLYLFTVVNHSVGQSSKGNDFCICKRCNAKHTYVAANQKDGSYVCFECR